MNEIAVVSGKGGTGKTSLTAALSMLRDKLVVVDCDVDAANLPIILQPLDYHNENFIAGRKAIIDQTRCMQCPVCLDHCRFGAISRVNGEIAIAESVCDGCGLCARLCPQQAISMHNEDKSWWAAGMYEKGYLVHARLAPGEENSGKLVHKIRQYGSAIAQEKDIDTVLIDGPPGIGCPVISALTGVSQVIIVAEPSQSAFHDMKRLLSLVRQFGMPVALVINKFDLHEAVCSEMEAWSLSHELPVLRKIPFDEALLKSMVQCKSVVDCMPDSPAAIAIKKIGKHIFTN